MSLSDFFLQPQAWPWLFLLLPLAWWISASERKRSGRIQAAFGSRHTTLAFEAWPQRRNWQNRTYLAAAAFSLLALMEPAWGEGGRGQTRQGVDLVFCLDLSRSMLAEDLSPNRLQKAQQEIQALAKSAEGHRMALVHFAGEARLSVPLTRDMDSFAELVAYASPEDVRKGGTDLGAALETALEAVENAASLEQRKPAVLVLVTDGEDLQGKGLLAAEVCRQRGFTLHTVGMGTALGSKIPIPTEDGEQFLTDDQGQEVVSSLDASGLKQMAEMTGGAFVHGSLVQDPLQTLYRNRILPLSRFTEMETALSQRRSRFQWPLLFALGLWLLEWWLADRSRG